MDYAFFHLRLGRGTGLGGVVVEQYIQVPLKGNKVEFTYAGETTVICAHSVLPQYFNSQWGLPCWWRERHRTIWTTARVQTSDPPFRNSRETTGE